MQKNPTEILTRPSVPEIKINAVLMLARAWGGSSRDSSAFALTKWVEVWMQRV